MPYSITKVDVWSGLIEDRPGGLAQKLDALAAVGANLEFVLARRAPDQPGIGVVFLAPISGAKQKNAAKAAGLEPAHTMFSLRLEGPDKKGLGACITQGLGMAGINLRGLSAAAVGRKCVIYFAFDSKDEATKAAKFLKKSLK